MGFWGGSPEEVGSPQGETVHDTSHGAGMPWVGFFDAVEFERVAVKEKKYRTPLIPPQFLMICFEFHIFINSAKNFGLA